MRLKKWQHLLEADRKLLLSQREFKAGNETLESYLAVARRAGLSPPAALKQVIPKRVKDVKDDVVKSAARAMFVSAWVDHEEREGRYHSGELYNIAPDTSRRAKRSAKALIKKIEQLNRPYNINQLYWVALNLPGRRYRTPTVDGFGFGIAMPSLGYGVAWEDNHPDPEIKLPHWDFDIGV